MKRLRWMIVGAGLGWVAQRKVRSAVRQGVGDNAPDSLLRGQQLASNAIRRVGEAVEIGRTQRLRTEQTLSEEIYGAKVIDVSAKSAESSWPN